MERELSTLFKSILEIDSTSGKEQRLANWLYETLEAPHKELMEVGDGTYNLLLRWGESSVLHPYGHRSTLHPSYIFRRR